MPGGVTIGDLATFALGTCFGLATTMCLLLALYGSLTSVPIFLAMLGILGMLVTAPWTGGDA